MGLSTRELLLVLRARDEASRVLHGFRGNLKGLDREARAAAQSSVARGGALATAGIAIAAGGAAALVTLNGMTNAAMEYNQQVARTFTQVDKVNVSMDTLKKMGLDVATTVPVAFEQIQGTLYDIFSSIDTDAPGAAKLLRGIAQAAVGGDVSMDDAGRGIIGILNAYKMKATDVNHVNDVMFQLVRKGVGTYKQFDSTIGRAVPSAVKAGQSIETLAGMMAFLTRNGLSAAMAAASSGRALDALANGKSIAAFRDMGDKAEGAIKKAFGKETVAHLKDVGINFDKMSVNMLDKAGKMRTVPAIVKDLNRNLAGLTKAQKAVVMQELFKGSGGTIQAMRFFNHALNDSDNLLGRLTTDMNHAKGASADAYKVMSNTPQAKILLLNNRYHAMKIMVGDQLLPAKLKLVEVLGKILTMFTNMDPKLRNNIVRFVSIAAVIAVLLGTVISLVGGLMILSGTLVLMGTSLGAVILIATGVGLALAALVVAGILVYKNWDLVKAKAIQTWNAVVAAIMPVVDFVKHDFVRAFQNAIGFAIKLWNDFYSQVRGPALQIADAFMQMVDHIMGKLREFSSGMSGAVESAIRIWHAFGWLMRNFIWPVLQGIIWIVESGLIGAFKALTPVIIAVFQTAGDIIGRFIEFFHNFVMLFINLINGDWKAAWGNVVGMVKAAFNLAIAILNGAARIFLAIIKGLVLGVISFFKHLWDVLVGHSIIPDLVNGIINWFARLPGSVLSLVAGLIGRVISYFAGLPGKAAAALASLGSAIVNRWEVAFVLMLIAIKGGISKAVAKVKEVPGLVKEGLGDLGSLLIDAGEQIINGLVTGIGNMAGAAVDKAVGVAKGIAGGVAHSLGIKSPSKVFHNIGLNILQGLINGLRAKKIDTAFIGRISSMIVNAKKRGHSGLARWLDKDNAKLIALSSKRTAIAKKLAAAEATLAARQKAFSDMRSNVTNAIMQTFDITKYTDVKDMTNVLKDKLKEAKDFAAGIKKLTAAGVNKNLLASIAAQGPEAGAATIQGLLHGSKKDLAAFNKTYAQFVGVAQATGTTVAASLYQAGINAAKGLVAGLKSQQAAIQKQMNTIATAMVAAIKRALGIHSPSRVFLFLGKMIGLGLSKGLKSMKAEVADASNVLISGIKYIDNDTQFKFPSGGPAGAGGPMSKGRNVIFQAGSVVTQEIDPIKHAADLGWELTRVVG